MNQTLQDEIEEKLLKWEQSDHGQPGSYKYRMDLIQFIKFLIFDALRSKQ